MVDAFIITSHASLRATGSGSVLFGIECGAGSCRITSIDIDVMPPATGRFSASQDRLSIRRVNEKPYTAGVARRPRAYVWRAKPFSESSRPTLGCMDHPAG